MSVLLKNGQSFDHRGKRIEVDILIEEGRILEKGKGFAEEGHQVIDCSGKWVFPGLVDLHVHLREPGFEAKETIETGSMAAAKGGFTTIACMPNTKPVLDHEQHIQFVQEQAKSSGFARVLPIGAISVRQLGRELTDFEALQRAGVLAVSDDGVGVQSSQVMKEAMIKAHRLGLPVIAHCEDDTLLNGGCVHDGKFARQHGLRGIPSESESIMWAGIFCWPKKPVSIITFAM
jgi:dihydroorotase